MKTSSLILAFMSVVFFSSCAIEMGCPGHIGYNKHLQNHRSYSSNQNNAPVLNKNRQSESVVTASISVK